MVFALMQPSYANFIGVPAGSLTLIGYGHGHVGHFLFADATSGKVYAAASTDGYIFVKTNQWAANIPNSNYPVGRISDDMEGVQLGNMRDLFPAAYSAGVSYKDAPYSAVSSGPTANIGGYQGSATAVSSPLLQSLTPTKTIETQNILPTDPAAKPSWYETNKKWALPTFVTLAIAIIGGGAWLAFKK